VTLLLLLQAIDDASSFSEELLLLWVFLEIGVKYLIPVKILMNWRMPIAIVGSDRQCEVYWTAADVLPADAPV
jgi:hypothetical protein